MRWLLPRSLRGRLIMLMLAALVLAQALSLWLFLDERSFAVRSALSYEAADRAANIVTLLQQAPADLRPAILRAANSPFVRFTIDAAPAVDHLDHAGNPAIAAQIRMLLGGKQSPEVRVELHERRASMPPMPGASPEMERMMHVMMDARRPSAVEMRISIALASAGSSPQWLNVATRFHSPPYQWAWPEAATFFVTAALLVGVLWLALGQIIGPLQRLATSAARLGRGEEIAPLTPSGPEELRALTTAFNDMQARIHRFMAERTHLLAALGHDLRSPLTALRVRAEMVDDDETRTSMIATIGEMQQMVDATLAFARGMASSEPAEEVELVPFLRATLRDIAGAQRAVTLADIPDIRLRVRPATLRRALRNLIENALRYGNGAHISAHTHGGRLLLTIDDTGPGIPSESIARVFEPFVRLENSRSRETGGTGLGLSIARTIILAHGGEIDLENRPEGGLRVRVTLPL